MKRLIILALVAILAVAACDSDADVASRNLSVAAEQFEIQRRITFINGITDEYLLTIEGRCSVETLRGDLAGALEVTCRRDDNTFVKHFLGLSDNVTFLVEQLVGSEASTQRYRVVFKPEAIVPDIDLE